MGSGRQKGDGKGRYGGRVAGTPNKNKGIKAMMSEELEAYFMPSIETKDKEGNDILISKFKKDFDCLEPDKRVKVAADMLNYTIPKMQATSVDMTMGDRKRPLTERLAALVDGEEPPNAGE